ncbi:hypothetical protein MUP77_22855 [Candidatus Bathyarchaeota archaeon]|nr:hypothetical protein [Candidatus Bathyarchaeota archaeon]
MSEGELKKRIKSLFSDFLDPTAQEVGEEDIQKIIDDARKDLEAKAKTTNEVLIHAHDLKGFATLIPNGDRTFVDYGAKKWVSLDDVLKWFGAST